MRTSGSKTNTKGNVKPLINPLTLAINNDNEKLVKIESRLYLKMIFFLQNEKIYYKYNSNDMLMI